MVRMKAARVGKQGGIEEIQVTDIPVPTVKPNEILIKVEWSTRTSEAAFILARSRLRSAKKVPARSWYFRLRAKLNSDEYKIRGFKQGAKVVAYASGSFAEYVAVPWKDVQLVPEGLSLSQAAASLAQGLTALTFVKEAYPVKKGDWILVHAAAGGAGLLFTQLANQLGANVIGTTSTPAKAEIAKKAGAKHVILYTETPVSSEVLKLTDGRGVEAIFDGVGASTWEDDFVSIRRKGTIVSYGNASGVVPPFSVLKLGAKNVKVCRVGNYLTEPAEFHQYSSELLELIKDGKLNIAIHAEYPFTTEGIRQTQIDISGRGTSGNNSKCPNKRDELSTLLTYTSWINELAATAPFASVPPTFETIFKFIQGCEVRMLGNLVGVGVTVQVAQGAINVPSTRVIITTNPAFMYKSFR
ncbi:zinc-binding dehydrogenase domain-containing protein [Rhizoctonia solani AG-1 IA]|uniref:Probable quinone oxidoreductase n=1 Tax=Thanatephorus cucumeris (strain AG1-IA) TaxID=983506 RepID=L8WIJ6_THACA|nr:zinc-binding dehydrogenase domain-containing protein [Rhizoctonia solani AG-1 IA]